MEQLWSTRLLPRCPLGLIPGVEGKEVPRATKHRGGHRSSQLSVGSSALKLLLLTQGPRVGAKTLWMWRATPGLETELWAA